MCITFAVADLFLYHGEAGALHLNDCIEHTAIRDDLHEHVHGAFAGQVAVLRGAREVGWVQAKCIVHAL